MKLQALLCLQFAVFVSCTRPPIIITEVSNSSEANSPSAHHASGSSSYEDDFRSMQHDLNRLKISLVQKDDKECIGRLDSSLHRMKEHVDAEHRETILKREKIEILLDTLTQAIDKVRKELDSMRFGPQNEAEQSEQVASNGLPAGCVKDIRSKDFAAAGEKLHKITELDQIKSIVRDVYDRQPNNFDLVLSFADSVGTTKKAFLVYKALLAEMESNGHNDVVKTLKLIDSIDRKVVHDTVVAEEDGVNGSEEDAHYSVFRMKNKVKLATAEKIKEAMLRDDMKNEEIQKISRSVHEFSRELFEEVMRMVVAHAYAQIPAGRMLENIRCFGHVEQLISGYVAVYDVLMENDKSGNNPGLFPLAEHIKAAMEMKDYPQVSHDRRCIFEGLKYRLPKSVRNIVFLPKICFKNSVLDEYLFAGSNYTDEKRFVYSWLPHHEKDVKEVGVWGAWITTYERGTFDIYNVYNKEFLYADLAGHDDQRRFIFTWSGHKKKLPPSSRWLLIPDGDHVLVQNAETREYLYADPEKRYDTGKHHVFALRSGKVIKEGVWFAENCMEPLPLYH